MWKEDAVLLELSKRIGRPASYISAILATILLYLGISEHSLLGIRALSDHSAMMVIAVRYDLAYRCG